MASEFISFTSAASGPAPIPLVLTHGWPGSFLEMLKIIPLLTDPASYGGDPAQFIRRGGSFSSGLWVFRPASATGHEYLAHCRTMDRI